MSEQPDNTRLESQEPENLPEEPVEEKTSESPEKAPETPEKAPISEKKRTALLRYMAVLFGVAFLLVLLSFLIQIRDSRETISDLHQSNASALQNAVQLQEQNQALSTAKDELELQLEEQEDAVEDLEDQLEKARTEATESGKMAQEEEALRLSYELLFKAMDLYNQEDYEGCMAVLEDEIPQEDLEKFPTTAKGIYDQLLAKCQEQVAAQTAAEE